MSWRELLEDRMLVTAAWLNGSELRDWTGGPPRDSGPRAEERHYALLCSPDAKGIESEFTERGQIVRVNILVDDLRQSEELRGEWITLAERLCYRHKLDKILCVDRDLLDVSLEAAERIKARLITAPGALASADSWPGE
jgi:hypothetical protein